MWTPNQIEQHKKAAKLLTRIKDEAFVYISENAPGVSEWQVHEFILSRYKKYGLTVARNQTIVAFGENTRHIHYYPQKRDAKSLRRNELVMIDIWARLKESGAPYADITWMGYYRGISNSQFLISKKFKEAKKIFDVVAGARDLALKFINAHAHFGILPTGREVDAVARNYITEKGFGKTFRHSTGHGLGLVSPHWRGRNIAPRNRYALLENIGYTIEPGVYLDEVGPASHRFGVRSEMNFYLDEKLTFRLTTPLQDRLALL